MQRNLFPTEPPPPTTAGLFVDVVFDRPLDHAFTYAVSDALRDQIAVGKRLRVPFGRGDKSIVGYCVGISQQPPERAVKEVQAVLDEESLLTETLLRLTRWMADYYLCGWGQVLNAVIPAGARDQAGTRRRTFLEAVPPGGTHRPHRRAAAQAMRRAATSAPGRQTRRGQAAAKADALRLRTAEGAARQGADPPGVSPDRSHARRGG